MKRLFYIIIPFLLLGGCGGSSSSGGGGAYAGAYVGYGSGTVTVRGTSHPFGGSFVIVIDSDGSVAYQEGGKTLGTTTLNGNQFVVNIPAASVNASCSGVVKVNGTVVNGQITGTFSSSGLACYGVPGTIKATFSAHRNARAPATNLIESILKTVH